MIVDVFTIRPTDTAAIRELVDLLAGNCDTEQSAQFLADLGRWHRAEGRAVPKPQREEARRELAQWEQFFASLSDATS